MSLLPEPSTARRRARIDYLLAPARQQRALAYGFGPAPVDVPVGAPVDAAMIASLTFFPLSS